MTLNTQDFYQILHNLNIDFYTGVPDSLLKPVCAYINDVVPAKNHIIAENEGGAVALAIGYHLSTGKIPLVYMQNSGLGNAINPLLSLVDREIYQIPMVLLIGWRGQPGKKDEPQHKTQGRVMLSMLDAMEIPYLILSKSIVEAKQQLSEAINQVRIQHSTLAIIVETDTFEPYTLKNDTTKNQSVILSREQAIKEVVSHFNSSEAFFCTTGMAGRELYEIREKNTSHNNSDFLTIGGMGHASLIALNCALTQPNRTICCLDGDGAMLMHMGAMAIIGQMQPKNYIHILLNNETHDSVGGQPTAARTIKFCQIAKSVGYQEAVSACSSTEIINALILFNKTPGPHFLEIKIKPGARKDLGRPKTSSIENKEKFMRYLQCT